MIAESLMGYVEQLRQNKQNVPQGRRKSQLEISPTFYDKHSRNHDFSHNSNHQFIF